MNQRKLLEIQKVIHDSNAQLRVVTYSIKGSSDKYMDEVGSTRPEIKCTQGQ